MTHPEQTAAHTPGEWHVNTDGWKPWEGAIEVRGGGDTIAWTPSGIGNELANANLIAAAPAMAEYIAGHAAAGDVRAWAIMEGIHGHP